MFKSVEYTGFDANPELLAKAKQLEVVLANEIHTWQEDVEVRWAPHSDSATSVLDLTLSLALENGVSGTQTGTIYPEDFTRPRLLASRCGQVWSGLLGVLLEKQHKRVEEFLLEPTEA